MTVTVDCSSRKVQFEVAGAKLETSLAESVASIDRYGFGGANADNLFTAITVR